MDKFQSKYRIPSSRLQKWDYSWNALYFVTICTENRVCWFGEIRDHEMHLSEIGEILTDQWLKTPVIRPDMNIILDVFAIMPNHFHGIIDIGENEFNERIFDHDDDCRDAMHGVSTSKTNRNRYGPQIKNLPSIIRGFKSAVTINARKINPGFAWQSRYYDIIIQDKKSYNRIRNYIIDNPENWGDDDFHGY